MNGGIKMGLSDRGREERPLHRLKANTKAETARGLRGEGHAQLR